MSDEAARERHERHEANFLQHDSRIGVLEDGARESRLWRTGNGNPHRGAEARITKIEEGAVMRVEMKQIAAEVVTAYLKSFRGVLQTAAPYILLVIGAIYMLVTGKTPPKVGP